MSYRFMRVLVMFDLPALTSKDQKKYREFRKFLLKNGFMMMQESIYCKLALNQTASKLVMQNVRKNKPDNGLVQMITITEKQYSNMEILTGEINSDILDSDKRLVVF